MTPSSDAAPTVLLLRDSTMYTTALFLERALAPLCNLKTVYVNQFPDLLKAVHAVPRSLGTRAFEALLGRSIRFDRAYRHADLVLLVEPAVLGFVPSAFGATTAFYAIDSHRMFARHVGRDRVAEFDHLFVAQKDFLPRYEAAGCRRVHWLPLAHDPAIHRPLGLPKRRGIVFVGNPWPGTERGQVIERMRREADMEVAWAYQLDMVRAFNEARIVFNRSLSGDVNMRVFEALGCGAFLLTDRCANGFEELFRVGEELVGYGSVDEALELTRHYLASDADREAIAARGHARAVADHTYDARARAILREALGFEAPRPVRESDP